MCIELAFHYVTHIRRIWELFLLWRFRKTQENGFLAEAPPVVWYWMLERPLRYIALFRDRKLLCLIRQLRKQGAKIAIYSDYPVQKKIAALSGLTVDYCFCAADAAIKCLKPDAQGLKNIIRLTGETVENSLFIGDRYEKDGKCAVNIGMDYIILDTNPLLRNIKLYKKELYSG